MRDHDEQSTGGEPRTPGPEDLGDAFFERLVESASDAVLTASADGTVVYANEAVESLLGYDPAAVRGRAFLDFAPERFRDRYESWLARHANGDAGAPPDGDTFEVTWTSADGEHKRLSASAFEHESDGRKLFTGLLREAPDADEDERLREEALVEEIFDTSPMAISVRDAEGELLRANERAAELAGIDTDRIPNDLRDGEAGGEWTLYDAEGRPREHPVEQVLRTGEPLYGEEVVVELSDGERLYLSVSAAPVYEADAVDRVVTTAKDITELKQTQFEVERRRDELETELAEVFERVTDAFFALNNDWEFTYVNDEAEELLRRTEADLVGENFWDAFPETAGTTFQREYEQAMETQQQRSFVEYYPPLSTWFDVRAYPSDTGLSVYFQDVTERKERERELQNRVRQQRVLADFSQQALSDRSLDELLDEAVELVADTLDHEYCKVLELSPDGTELLLRNGVGWREGIAGSETVANDRGSQAGYTLIAEEPVVVEDLESDDRFSGPELLASHDVRGGISTIIGSADDPWGIFGTHDTAEQSYADHDVQFVQSVANILTAAIRRRQRERDLEASEGRYRTLVENFPNGTVLLLDEDLRYLVAGGQIFEEMAVSPEDLKGRTIHESLPEGVLEVLEPKYRAALDGEPNTFEVEHEGKTFRAQAVPVEDPDGEVTAVMVVTQDVTQRKERKQRLERYETVVETADDGIYVVGADGRLSMVNSAFAEMTGYDREEIVGATPLELGLYDESVTDAIEERERRILDGEQSSATVELTLYANDGRAFPAESTFVLLPTEAGHERIGIVRDVTERKERERELEAQNERLDAFASMLAHELRNPLEIAQIYLDMGVDTVGADPDAARSFREVEQALDRIEEMIDTLLVVTRRGGSVDNTQSVNLGEVAEEWWETVDGRDGTLEVLTDRTVRADRSRLRQLLENLFRNAVEHAGPDATVRLGDLDGGFYVEDDGPGIPESERENVFEPGYSTSNVGIGFGLAVVGQLADAHGWDCEITESPEGGARFEFRNVEGVEE